MSNVIPLGCVTRLDLPTDRVLDAAKGRCSKGVVVMGFDDDGALYFASSIADGGEVIWLVEKLKQALVDAISEKRQRAMVCAAAIAHSGAKQGVPA